MDDSDGPTIAEFYGWFYTLHYLSKDGGILKLTGETEVTKVNIITMFNWLALEQDLNREKIRKEKQMLAEYRARRR
jgi:hypothetical protein